MAFDNVKFGILQTKRFIVLPETSGKWTVREVHHLSVHTHFFPTMENYSHLMLTFYQIHGQHTVAMKSFGRKNRSFHLLRHHRD